MCLFFLFMQKTAYEMRISDWSSDVFSSDLINPEVALFANPIAQTACAADCGAATLKLPLDPLFWGAGCLGSMYPMNGNISEHIGHVQSSRLALSRAHV